MATSGTISGSRLSVYWTVNRQDKETNGTLATATFNATFPTVSAPTPISGTITAGGVSKSFGFTIYPGMSSTQLGSIQVYIYHNLDGTGGMSVSGSYQLGSITGSVSGWAQFPKIDRQATLLTAPNFNDEENPTITYSNPMGENATGLAAAISLDGSNPDVPYRDIDKTASSYTFRLTEEEKATLRAATDGSNSRSVYFYLRTIIGDDYYFSYKEVTFTIVNGEPEIIATVKDTNPITLELTGDEKTLVKYFSNAHAYMNMVAYKEAYFTAYYMENGGNRVDTSYSHTFNKVEDDAFYFYVADNRNNGVAQTYYAPMVDYVKLSCSYEERKLNPAGEMEVRCSGNYFNDTFGAADNTLLVEFRYKEQNGEYSEWLQMSATFNGNSYIATYDISGLDYRKTYVFQCRAEDKLSTVVSAETAVKSFPLFHWGADDFTFEVPVIFKAGTQGDNGGESSTITHEWNGTTLTITSASGTSSMDLGSPFTEQEKQQLLSRVSDVEEECEDMASRITTLENKPSGGGGDSNTEYGEWLPTFAAEQYISNYTMRKGWYSKVGNIVNVGFMVKAYTNSGGIGTIVRLTGVPYLPSIAAFGGGIGHNLYAPGGFTFTGWGIDENGIITGRGQSCNLTTSQNQEITSTLCYAASGNLMTLSGTICYTTDEE